MALTDESVSFDPDFAGPAEWADLYRRNGLQVVPAHFPDARNPAFQWKRPKLPDWKQLQEEIVPDLTFVRWYGPGGEHASREQMGILTGHCSGNIGVIDLDTHTKPASLHWWRGLLAVHNNGIEPETWEQKTGGGGRQILFVFPADFVIPTIKTSLGVDIRGQGGFAMLPPSRHESGACYQWCIGRAPYDISIELAPDWLCEALMELWSEHGGGTTHTGPVERVASSGADMDAFGSRVDGREDFMTRLVWGAVLDMHRECPLKPSEAEASATMRQAYQVYERAVKSRLAGDEPKSSLLEREGRGASLFADKWKRAIAKWEREVAQGAALPKLAPDDWDRAKGGEEIEFDADGAPKKLILSAAEFVAGFTPPDYLIDGLLQRGYLYSFTARTGAGKTAVSLYLAQAVGRGVPIHGRETVKGPVLFLAGENPSDVRARYIVMADHWGFDPSEAPVYFIDGVINIERSLEQIRRESVEFALVIVDTAAAYYVGDDGNSNVQQGAYARLLRQLSFLPGKPSVIVPAHPVKNASKDNMIPVGGGAFLNEVDGNLTLWNDGEQQTTLHWQGKFRGPEFEPLNFKLISKTSDKVHDRNGCLIPSVVATPMSDAEADKAINDRERSETALLFAIADHPKASIAALCRYARLVDDRGAEQKSKAFRIIERLVAEKLVERQLGKPVITHKGKKAIGRNDD